MLFREVELPEEISGRLYLHSMPGRQESLAEIWGEIHRQGISLIVCLAPANEIRQKSPQYADAIERAAVPCTLRLFPIRDYQVPEDDGAFCNAVVSTANFLCAGERVLLHCGAGIGRTGMFAIATLMAVGLSEREARRRIEDAGSWAENPAQEEAFRRFGEKIHRIKKLADYCDKRLDLKRAELNEEYFYQSLPLCVIDSVYSIGVNYEGTRNTAIKYCNYYGLQRIRENRNSLPKKKDQESIGEFIRKSESLGTDFFSRNIFKNMQRTSSKSGILKCEAVLLLAKCLHRYGVEYFQDIYKVIDDERFEKEVRSIPGQHSGISLSYFFMLSGSDDLIKPDRWIINFISGALNLPCSQSYAQRLLSGACEILKQKYPRLTPRLLDNTIWRHQRDRKDNKRNGGKHTQSKIPSCFEKGGISMIGSFKRHEIVLCSADAGPGSQRQVRECEAQYLFPGGRWVRAFGNAATRLNCRFVILTTGHGMVNPHDLITPFDVHISGNEEVVKRKWIETIPPLLKRGEYRVLLFYSGGCPRDPYIEIMRPILHDLGIELLSFGRPNMRDINKVDNIIELLIHGTTFGELRSVLRLPERLVYYPILKVAK